MHKVSRVLKEILKENVTVRSILMSIASPAVIDKNKPIEADKTRWEIHCGRPVQYVTHGGMIENVNWKREVMEEEKRKEVDKLERENTIFWKPRNKLVRKRQGKLDSYRCEGGKGSEGSCEKDAKRTGNV